MDHTPKIQPVLRSYCGTEKGARQHYIHLEYMCQPCNQAHTDYAQARKIVNRKKKSLLVPIETVIDWLNKPASVLADHYPPIIVAALKSLRKDAA